MTENAIAKEIVDAAYRIHTTLGPGLLESVYHAVLAYELAQRGLRTVSQQAIPVVYGTIRIDIGFRADLIVEDQVIVEIKSVEVLAPVHKKQLLTYLRLADKRLGLLINFNAALIKDGITRIVNGLQEESLAKRRASLRLVSEGTNSRRNVLCFQCGSPEFFRRRQDAKNESPGRAWNRGRGDPPPARPQSGRQTAAAFRKIREWRPSRNSWTGT